jgi:predicted nucleic acid-binding protein
MACVVDASLAATWFLPDEADPATATLGEEAARDPPVVPSLFLHEMRSLLISAARRGRASRDAILRQLEVVERLYRRNAGPGDGREIAHLAFKHGLTTYDATYLALARDEGLPLATLDKELAAAARAEKVPILGPLSP